MPKMFAEKASENVNIKRRIAEAAWAEIISKEENPRLLIDAGSSAEWVARVIEEKVRQEESGQKTISDGAGRNAYDILHEKFTKENWDQFVSDPQYGKEELQKAEETLKKEKRQACNSENFAHIPAILTHNLAAWEALRTIDILDLYLIGGRYNNFLNAIVEPEAFKDAVKNWFPNMTIVATSGIDSVGLYCSNRQDEKPVKDHLVKHPVEKVVIIADHSKIGKTDVRQFATWDDLLGETRTRTVYLVTDEWEPDGKDKLPYKNTIKVLKDNPNIKIIKAAIDGSGDSKNNEEDERDAPLQPIKPKIIKSTVKTAVKN